MSRCACLSLLLGFASHVSAEPGTDLAASKRALQAVQLSIVADVEALDPEFRRAAWEQYYTALEQLQRMDVHQQMMARHDQDRAAQFAAAAAAFDLALEELERLLEKPGAE